MDTHDAPKDQRMSSSPLTAEAIQQQLSEIGINPRGTLLLHLSLKAVGLLENGGDTLLDAFMDYMKDGLLVIPTHTWDTVHKRQPIFDVKHSLSCIGWVPELFRKRRGVVRSLHPTHSLAAAGHRAKSFLEGQERFPTPCHPDSAYGKILREGADVLLIGVDFGRNTLIHCIEEIAQVPDRLSDDFYGYYAISDEGQTHSIFSRRHQNANSDHYIKLQPVMEHKGTLRQVKIGQATTLFFRSQDLLTDTIEMLQKDIHLFDDLTPVPERFYLGTPEEAHRRTSLLAKEKNLAGRLPLLRINANKRQLITDDADPFFWLGDTAWELFHALDREEVRFYLNDRQKKRFNVIQAVALAEFEGLTTPNRYGRLPMKLDAAGFPTLEPDLDGPYSYWDHVDYILDLAAECGIYIALLPTWGDKWNLAWGKGPVLFDANSAYTYGKWIGTRYQDRSNIIWVLGGDRAIENQDQRETVNAMAGGIEEASGHRQLMTFHPSGESTSLDQVAKERWLDFHMLQSGHARRNFANHKMIERTLREDPTRPVLDAEPRYEDHPIGFKPENGLFDAADVRQAAYWSVLSGGLGISYGHHSVWSMTRYVTDYFILDWKEALDRPGSWHLSHLRSLIESRPQHELRPASELLKRNYTGANWQAAARGDHYAFIYTPQGMPLSIRSEIFDRANINSSWFNPRSGQWSTGPTWSNIDEMEVIPPSRGRLEDWVLVLDW